MLCPSLTYLNAGCLSLCLPPELQRAGHFWSDSPPPRHQRWHLKGSVETPNSFQRPRASESERPTIYMPKLVALNPSLSEKKKKERKKKGVAKLSKKPRLQEET